MKMNEELLNAWLKVSTSIVNSRVVSELPYNESLVCNILYRNLEENEEPLTATTLCEKTNMLKSQMNRTLNLLENKSIVRRERSTKDKRNVYVTLIRNQDNAYEKQHIQILELLDKIIESLGTDKTQEIIGTLNCVSDIANKIINNREVTYD